jgi:trigger factor
VPSTVEQLSPSRVKLTIEIPFAELQPHLDKAYREIAQSVNIPGFRRGKVPPAIIDQRFGRGAVLQDAINAALPAAYSRAVEEARIIPLGEPDVDVTKLEDRTLVEFTAEVDVRPDFDLPDFSTLSATVAAPGDREAEIDDRIETMRQRFATRSDVDRAAERGDIVTIDISASQDGKEIVDAHAEGLSYKVGAEGMIEGLDEAVLGKSAGDEVDFPSKLVGGPFKGQEAVLHVVVHKVQEEKLPDLDDDFAQMISEFDTVDEIRADLGKRVDELARLEQVQQASDKVLEELVTKLDFEVPQALLDAQVTERTQQITNQLAQAGYTLERYLEENEEEADTPEAFWAEVAANTAKALKAQIVLDKLADEQEIGVEQQDLTEMLFRRAAQSGSSPEQEMQHMMEHGHTQEWMQEIRRTKALKAIVEAATVTDESGAVVDVTAVRPDGSLAAESPESPESAESPDSPESPESADSPESAESPESPEK